MLGSPSSVKIKNHAISNGENFLDNLNGKRTTSWSGHIVGGVEKRVVFSWVLFKTCVSEHLMFPFCPPPFVRCFSGAGMPLPFFGKGLAQLCSPIAIAIARLVYACVFSCWIWPCLWRELIHFLASILWVAAKHCPHLHYELWSSCCGLWILQQIVLGNGCRNDEPTSIHGLSLDSMDLHQILARSHLWRLQKIHKRESFGNSLVEAYQSWPVCNAPTYWRYRKVVELWSLNFRIDVPSTSNTLWPFSTLSFSLPNASHCWRFNHRRPTHLRRSYTFHVFEKKVAKQNYCGMTVCGPSEFRIKRQVFMRRETFMKLMVTMQTSWESVRIDNRKFLADKIRAMFSALGFLLSWNHFWRTFQ